MDSAERPGKRGRRQTLGMVGMFIAWPKIRGPKIDGQTQRRNARVSDFTLRVALLVHVWHKTGLSIQGAVEKVCHDYKSFLMERLGKGKRGKRSKIAPGVEIDEVVRTMYYTFIKRVRRAGKDSGVQKVRPSSKEGNQDKYMDVLLEVWLEYYQTWCDWVISADESAIDVTEQEYISLGKRESATVFRELVRSIRANADKGLLSVPRIKALPLPAGYYQTVQVNGKTLLLRVPD
jgi:hypothetical protein